MDVRYFTTEVLILGAGAAGLATAIRVAEQKNVALLCKGSCPGGASMQAQGGIAIALAKDDHPDFHAQDTMTAGAGLCKPEVVCFVSQRARAQLDWLIAQGVAFNQENAATYHLAREGGHRCRRVVHVDDATGAAIQSCLADVAQRSQNIDIFPRRLALKLLVNLQGEAGQRSCWGALIYNEEEHVLEVWQADDVILATGGASHCWPHATSQEVMSGDGISMAFAIGAHVQHLQFQQFHPTCLFTGASTSPAMSFLLSESLRGEGAVLRLPNGYRFMPDYHPAAELAPRDIVARAMDTEMRRHQLEHLYLDITHQSPHFIMQHFPMIARQCQSLGWDISREWLPIVSGAHYTCGGVVTDLQGQTNIQHLYALGEVACTGLHGANRIASNSLLECFVFSEAIAHHLLSRAPTHTVTAAMNTDFLQSNLGKYRCATAVEDQLFNEKKRALQDLMRRKAGIVRTQEGLCDAQSSIEAQWRSLQSMHGTTVSRAAIELHHLYQVSHLIVQAASASPSCGAHYLTGG